MLALPPAKRSQSFVDILAATECPAFTARRARRAERSGAPQDPIVWKRAQGANVIDADGNRYVDFTAGFGVAAIGHQHPRWVEAVQDQSALLSHALGDLHPSDQKIALLDKLQRLAPWPGARCILGLNGSDAVESALKTAALATGKHSVLAFEGGYHGLAHGPLAACGYREAFRTPFAPQLNPQVVFSPWGEVPDPFPEVGAVLVEAIQGRGGVRLPPDGFLQALGEAAHKAGAVVIADEIFTGLARTGERWPHQALGLDADVVCIGKALGGGMPMSATLGKEHIMAAWGDSDGEAIHTGTFYGHPLASRAALETLAIIEDEALIERAQHLGDALRGQLEAAGFEVRGRGAMLGVLFDEPVLGLCQRLLTEGYVALPAGADAKVLQLVPPLTMDTELLPGFVQTLSRLS